MRFTNKQSKKKKQQQPSWIVTILISLFPNQIGEQTDLYIYLSYSPPINVLCTIVASATAVVFCDSMTL